MTYGTIKVDTVTFTDAGIDKSVTLSGLVQNPTFSGNVTVTGTLSGVTVTGTTANFTSGNFTNISGGTHTITSGVFAAGSAASPSITFTGDLNTGIYSPGADQVAISTGGSGRLFVDASGRLGVGTSSPVSTLSIRNDSLGSGGLTETAIVLTYSSTNYGQHFIDANGTYNIYANNNGVAGGNLQLRADTGLIFNTASNERLRIDSSGRLLVGTSSARSNFYNSSSYSPRLQLESANDGASSSIALISVSGGGFDEPNLVFAKSRGSAIGNNTIVASGDDIGNISFQASDGSEFVVAANILAEVDGTPGANDMPGRLVFATTADGASSPTERLRITSAGFVGVGTTSPAVKLTARDSNESGIVSVAAIENYITTNPSSGNGVALDFNLNNNGNAAVNRGQIAVVNTNFHAESEMRFYTATSNAIQQRMVIDSSGRVGIGTTSPGYALDTRGAIASTSASGIQTVLSFASDGIVGTVSNHSLTFFANNGERARIDTSGRLLVGTSSARDPGGDSKIEAFNGPIAISTFANSAGFYGLNFVKSRGTSTNVIVQNNDSLSAVRFFGADGTAYPEAARIEAFVDGTPGTNDMPGRLLFYTTSDGGSFPTERMRIDSSGRVGIGTTSPSAILQVSPSSGSANFQVSRGSKGLQINQDNDSADPNINTIGATALRFLRDGSESMRIDTSGRLLVGTSSASAFTFGGVTPSFQVEGVDASTGTVSIARNSNDANGAGLIISKSRGTTAGSNTIVSNNDTIADVRFEAGDGTQKTIAGAIGCQVDGTPGINDMPGRLVFSTTADGASSPTERMRITSAGKILYNTATAAANTAITITAFDNSVGGAAVELNGWGNGRGHAINFTAHNTASADVVYFNTSAATVGSISITSTATAYNTSSDYRLKENIVPVIDGIIRLQQLKPSRFNFLTDPSKVVDGFIAHEVQSVVPEAVTGTKDEISPDGTPKYQGIDQSKLVPLLTAALQEAIGEIESLKARVAALESA